MEKKDLEYTYHFKGMPFATLIAKSGIKLSGKLHKPFDILIVGFPNHLSLEPDPKKEKEPFGITTIGDIKNFFFGTDTYVVKK